MVREHEVVLETLRRRANRLRGELVRDLDNNRFVSDDIHMEDYNDIAGAMNAIFVGDPDLGSWHAMPDANVRSRGLQIAPMVVTERTLAHLDRILTQLDLILGPAEESRADPPEFDRAALTEVEKATVQHIDALRPTPGRPGAEPEALDFSFIAEPKLRRVLELDFIESQRAFAGSAFKASAILSGAVVEGTLMGFLQQWPDDGSGSWDDATAKFPRKDGDIAWERVSMTGLLEAAQSLGLIAPTFGTFTSAARDVRDTVHPNREVLNGWRADQEMATILLSLGRSLHQQFAVAQVAAD